VVVDDAGPLDIGLRRHGRRHGIGPLRLGQLDLQLPDLLA
jgi:hypothetical protein